MDEALEASRMDLFGGGGYADMMERSALQHAELLLGEARNRVLMAQRFDVAIGSLPHVRVAGGSIMTDVFFDNIFTDMAFHDKIKGSKVEVTQAEAAVREETARAAGRLQEARAVLEGREGVLRTKRGELQKLREDAFRRVAELGAPPPAYDAPPYGARET
jgi:hypothetical protein